MIAPARPPLLGRLFGRRPPRSESLIDPAETSAPWRSASAWSAPWGFSGSGS